MWNTNFVNEFPVLISNTVLHDLHLSWVLDMKKGAAMFIQEASWIRMRQKPSTTVPVFRKIFTCERPVREAFLEVTCDGVYEAVLNNSRVGQFILAPGWTQYSKRLQVQHYHHVQYFH